LTILKIININITKEIIEINYFKTPRLHVTTLFRFIYTNKHTHTFKGLGVSRPTPSVCGRGGDGDLAYKRAIRR
jgi:hypothetical protein